MTQPLTLEEFGSQQIPRDDIHEEVRLEAFDKGYAAGWDDATAAAERDAAASDQAVRARLEELGFTYHEARAHVMRSLTPLLHAIATTALPRIVRDTLGARLVEVGEDLAQDAAGGPITILTRTETREAVETALADTAAFPFHVETDDDLAEGHIRMSLGQSGRLIDTGAAARSLIEALSALDSLTEETLSRG